MSKFRKMGLVAAMEADEEILEAPADETEVALDVSETSAEVADEVEEVESAETSIDDATDDLETLGSIQAVMADSVESGEGLDEQAAEIAEIAVEAICARLGIKTAGRIMPATESFGSVTTRVAATKIALEAVEEKSKTIMESVKAAWAWIWQKIKEFIGKFTGNIEALEKQAGVLKTKLAAAKDYVPKDQAAELKDESVVKAFTVSGKFAPSEVLKGHVKLAAETTGLLDVTEKAVEEISASIKTAMTPDPVKADDFAKLVSSKLEGIRDAFGGAAGIGPLINGGKVKIGLDKDANGDTTSFTVNVVSETQNTVKSAKFLSVSEAESLLGEVETLLKSIRDYKAIEDRVKKLETSVIGKLTGAIKDFKDSQSAHERKVIKQINTSSSAVNKVVTKAALSFPGMNLSAARSALSFIAKSLASLEAPAAAKE